MRRPAPVTEQLEVGSRRNEVVNTASPRPDDAALIDCMIDENVPNDPAKMGWTRLYDMAGTFTCFRRQVPRGAMRAIRAPPRTRTATSPWSTKPKHEEQQQRLIDELNHRVKNTLATVQALVAMSKRYTTTTAEFAEAFSGRLQALSVAHNLLTEGVWQSTSLRDLIEAELRPYDIARFSIDGPDFDLSPKQAIAFAMIIHELATNAAKYGASVPSGKVSLKAREGFTAGEFDWKEHDGPMVQAPPRHGFGSQLINSSAQQLGGRCAILYVPNGFHCIIGLKLQWEMVQSLAPHN